MKFYPTIFNDVLSPITPGPSSSNTAAPFRIGLIGRDLLFGNPTSLKIEMSDSGGFVSSFYSMQSDKAFIGGFLGKNLIDFDLENAYEIAEAEELSFKFLFSDKVPSIPREIAEITVSSHEETITFTAISLGGGEILINKLNGQDVYIDGKHAITISVDNKTRLVNAVYPIITKSDAIPPFDSSEGMLKYSRDKKIPLWQAALDYESSLSGISQYEVWKIAEKTLDISYRSIEKGYRKDIYFDGVTSPKAKKFREISDEIKLIPAGASHIAVIDALSIMEYSNSHGTIVCMPTGGASGIIPAAIKNAADSMNLNKEYQIKALLTAGLIGLFYFPTHYSGAIGCQAEIGVAVSMASAGLASFLSDEPDVIEKAAVLGMQSLFGLICDPIGGYVQVPCFIRNMTAVSTSITCANAAVYGLDSLISLDEMVNALLRVGEKTGSLNDLGTCMCKMKKIKSQ